jgi:hypothetical protein
MDEEEILGEDSRYETTLKPRSSRGKMKSNGPKRNSFGKTLVITKY